MQLNGIDVSAVGQGANFYWQAWRGKIQFAAVKVSEGTTFADPDAGRNIAGARSIGCAVIGYHFMHAAPPAQAQADWFMACCKRAGLERGDGLALDTEQAGLDGLSAGDLWSRTSDVAAILHSHFTAWPLVYANLSLAVAAPSSVGSCPLWLANPSGTPVSHVGPWQAVSMEQTGIRGVDTDVFYGDAAQLAKLAIPAAAPPKPAAPARPTQAEAAAALDVLTRYVR